MMRVAVVGATGLIGRRVVASLGARGDEVVALVRGERTVPAASLVQWDGRGPVPPGAFDGCDAVLNLAGSAIGRRWSRDVKQEMVASRVDLTERVVDALAESGVGTLLNSSAVGYYGNREEPVDETAPPGAGFLADVCRRWEAAARNAEARGARVVLLRTGIVLATDGGALPQILGPAKFGLSGPIAGGKQWFPWIHIADTVALILWALDAPSVAGPVNVAAPGIVRQGEFAKTLGHAINRPAVTPTPAFAIRVMLGEGAELVLEGQHAIPGVALAGGYDFAFSQAEAALTDLL
jgi:uncharacterized protein (TIGR01777 family)